MINLYIQAYCLGWEGAPFEDQKYLSLPSLGSQFTTYLDFLPIKVSSKIEIIESHPSCSSEPSTSLPQKIAETSGLDTEEAYLTSPTIDENIAQPSAFISSHLMVTRSKLNFCHWKLAQRLTLLSHNRRVHLNQAYLYLKKLQKLLNQILKKLLLHIQQLIRILLSHLLLSLPIHWSQDLK